MRLIRAFFSDSKLAWILALFLFVLSGCSLITRNPPEMTTTEGFLDLSLPTPTTIDSQTGYHFSVYRSLEYKSGLSQFSLDDQYLAITPDNNIVRVLDFPSLSLVVDLQIPRSALNGSNAIAFSQGNKLVAVGGFEERVDLFELETALLIDSLKTEVAFPQSVSISDLTFGPNDEDLVISSNKDNGGIAVWSLASDIIKRQYSKPTNAISDSVCEGFIATSTWPTGVRLETEKPLVLFNLETNQFTAIELEGEVGSDVQFFDSCSKLAVIVDGDVYLINLQNFTISDMRDLIGEDFAIRMDITDDGILAVLTSGSYSHPADTIFGYLTQIDADYVLTLIDVIDNKMIGQLNLIGVTDIDLSADGKYLVVASHSNPVTIWSLQ